MNTEPKKEEVERSFSKTGKSRHVFVPNENMHGMFATSDKEIYVRDAETGVIRSARPKLRGKAARRREKAARRLRG
jgi:hypothetical protein